MVELYIKELFYDFEAELDEIQNVRLDRVKRLMTETDFSIREITDRSGYQTDDHLRRMFKRHFGMTMQEYRRVTK